MSTSIVKNSQSSGKGALDQLTLRARQVPTGSLVPKNTHQRSKLCMFGRYLLQFIPYLGMILSSRYIHSTYNETEAFLKLVGASGNRQSGGAVSESLFTSALIVNVGYP